MTDKVNQKLSTIWSSKPVRMKLFGAWEIDKTPPDCIPRLCSLNINRLTLKHALSQDIGSIIVAVRMQNSKRILRSNEISLTTHNPAVTVASTGATTDAASATNNSATTNLSSTLPESLDIELDLSFALQYPHFLKRNCNFLQVILQRRKRYKNKAILGFKTLASGLIDMAEVLQKTTIAEKNIYLVGHLKESGKNETIAMISISSLKSQPIDQESAPQRKGKFSFDHPDIYSDEEEFTSGDDASDSETVEDSNPMAQFQRRKERKQRKSQIVRSGASSNVQQRNLKQKLFNLIKKFRMPDSEAYDSEEKFQAALEKELMAPVRPDDIDEFFDDEELDDPDDLSDSGQEIDDNISISSTPKPSLRPYFSSCTLVEQEIREEDKLDDSPENSGADTSDTSQKYFEEIKKIKPSPESKFQEMKKSRLFQKENRTKESSSKERKPVAAALSFTSSTPFVRDDNSPKEFVSDQLAKVFSGDEQTIPEEIFFINLAECLHGPALVQAFERTSHIIATNSISDVKFAFNFLCTRIQKYCNANVKILAPIKLALIGSDAYVNVFLRNYVEMFSTKSPDWQNYFRFYAIPSTYLTNSSSLLHTYLASIDSMYESHFSKESQPTIPNSVVASSVASSAGDSNISINSSNNLPNSFGGAGSTCASDNAYVQDLYTKSVAFLKSAQTVFQIPIAEAMVTYRDRSGVASGNEQDSNQSFIPFICDAKIGLPENAYRNHSQEMDDLPTSPPSQSTSVSANERSSNEKANVVSPLTVREPNVSGSLTPPNSPSISANHSFSASKEHKEQQFSAESIDLQIDYWPAQPKSSDGAPGSGGGSSSGNKKAETSKFTVKNSFKNLQIFRLPALGETSISSLTLFYVLKEKKQKIMRLGKKKEKENDSRCQTVQGIYRMICSYKTTQSPIKVSIDGVEMSNVKFFQITNQWQTQIKNFPLVIFQTSTDSLNTSNLIATKSK